MKKALVLGVMALFAINMIANAQPGTRTAAPSNANQEVQKNEKTAKGGDGVVKANPEVIKLNQAKPATKPNGPEAKTATTPVVKESRTNVNAAAATQSTDNTTPKTTVVKTSKNNMGAAANTQSASDATAPKTTVVKESKNNMGAAANTQSANDATAPKTTLVKESKNNMGAAANTNQAAGKTNLSTASSNDHKLNLKPKTLKVKKDTPQTAQPGKVNK